MSCPQMRKGARGRELGRLLVSDASRAGIKVSLGKSGKLRIKAADAPEFLAHMLEHKTEILSHLRAKAAAEAMEERMMKAARGATKPAKRERRASAGAEAVAVLATSGSSARRR